MSKGFSGERLHLVSLKEYTMLIFLLNLKEQASSTSSEWKWGYSCEEGAGKWCRLHTASEQSIGWTFSRYKTWGQQRRLARRSQPWQRHLVVLLPKKGLKNA